MKLLELVKIWDQDPHSAFTDLIRYQDRFICAFRIGRAHASTDGRVRLMQSHDGLNWEPLTVVAKDGLDLRDADLSVTPDGRLMLLGGIADRPEDGQSVATGTFTCFSSDGGTTWTEPQQVVETGMWLWRARWYDGRAYGMAYPCFNPQDKLLHLMASTDGIAWEQLASFKLHDNGASEAAVRFDDSGRMFCYHRLGHIGFADPPYTDWTWHGVTPIGGPNLEMTPHGWVGGGRIYKPEKRTWLTRLDFESGTAEQMLELPSGGDSSYPGFVWHDGHLWVSYYSTHEGGPTSIYIAKVAVS